MRKPYPLDWPQGWPRTANRLPPRRFDTRFAYARDTLIHEIEMLGGSEIVITSNLPTRQNGIPYADGRATTNDPGIAVYWRQVVSGRVTERVMACDKWTSPAGNMRALALSIGALRGLERWGGSTIVDRAFSSFGTLPPAESDWRSVFAGCTSFSDVRTMFRTLAASAHPDVGGDETTMQRLNAAYAAAKAELGG